MEKKKVLNVKSPSIKDAINGKFSEKKSYSDKLKNPLWQRKRLEIMERDNFTCKLCNDDKTTLNVHHKKYIHNSNPWEIDNTNLITLCEHCHEVISREEFKNEKLDDVKILKYVSDDTIIYIVSVCKKQCYILITDYATRQKTGFNIKTNKSAFDIINLIKYSISDE